MQLIPRVATLIGALFVPGSAAAAQQIAFPPPVEVRIPKPPTITHGGGQSVLPYELHVTNFSRQPLTLQRIEVLNAESGASLVTLVDSALARSIARPAAQIPMAERAHIGPGLRAVVYMWVPLGNAIATPRTVRHRLTLVSDSVNAAPLMLETPAVAVTSNVLVIAPPLRGGVWLAANGPAAESGHRRALIPVEAGMFIAQRFAIDWVKVDEQARTFSDLHGCAPRGSSALLRARRADHAGDGWRESRDRRHRRRTLRVLCTSAAGIDSRACR